MQLRYYEYVYDPISGTMVKTAKWADKGEGYARIPGHRGELVTGTSTWDADRAAAKVEKERVARKLQERPKAETCGAWMKKNRESCASIAGHAGHHRGREASLARRPRAAA